MNKVRQADFGTPLSKSADSVKVEIDGLPATVKAGTSILRAARESGVDIPKLCATDSLKPFGSCRMCLVEVEGRKGFPASLDGAPALLPSEDAVSDVGSMNGSTHVGSGRISSASSRTAPC